jgi:glyoxylase-like metal-dependent hydrolase (beta-lactamase superfamily II)
MKEPAAIEKIYILDGGLARVEDGSIYSPGVNVGHPMILSCHAYLIRHQGSWMIWDSGTPDEVIAEPGGKVIAHGIRGIVSKTIASQLDAIGIATDDVQTIAFSHAHYDHVGNSRLFRKATWVVQRAEHDAMFGPDPAQYGYLPELYATLSDRPIRVVEGEHDVFGDGAVRMIPTPGHTLGHCSLLVRLPKRGPVLLSGDVAHNLCNLRCRRVPAFNVDQAATVASMEKIDALVRAEGAELWINHDIMQSGTLPHAPAYIV